MVKNTKYNIGGIRISINFLSPFLLPLINANSSLFIDNTNGSTDWTINFNTSDSIDINNLEIVFKGAEEFAEEVPYKWQLLQKEEIKYIHFEFKDDIYIECGLADIDDRSQTINLKLQIRRDSASIDPFFHPIGILLLQYLVHKANGFVMHASGVNYQGKGYLFSAVSGTGKSTMAQLWKSKGAKIINDDRVIVKPSEFGYIIYNTPMPYYRDTNNSVDLNNLFIIKQAPNNYIKPLTNTFGTLSLLGNCMQYHFDDNQIRERLDFIEDTVKKFGVFEVGFKPDTSIVELILEQFG